MSALPVLMAVSLHAHITLRVRGVILALVMLHLWAGGRVLSVLLVTFLFFRVVCKDILVVPPLQSLFLALLLGLSHKGVSPTSRAARALHLSTGPSLAALAAALWEAAEGAERAFSDWCFSAQFVILVIRHFVCVEFAPHWQEHPL